MLPAITAEMCQEPTLACYLIGSDEVAQISAPSHHYMSLSWSSALGNGNKMREDSPNATVFDCDWPGRRLPIMPGDFSQYVPHGFGLGAPLVIRPWDDPLKIHERQDYYGFQERDFDPVRGAPLTEPTGGTIYFNDDIEADDLRTILRVMQIKVHEQDYVVFAGASKKPNSDRYLEQARIMSKRAVRFLFGAEKEVSSLPDQPIPVGEYIAQFVAAQRHKWNASDRSYSWRLSGTFGGDGDFAKESLCFGFMEENRPYSVYRIWSRAWLVTK